MVTKLQHLKAGSLLVMMILRFIINFSASDCLMQKMAVKDFFPQETLFNYSSMC